MEDIDFKNNGIKIRRKGGYEAVIYFGEEVETALLDYLEQRNHIIPAEGNENALFLSLQNKRIYSTCTSGSACSKSSDPSERGRSASDLK